MSATECVFLDDKQAIEAKMCAERQLEHSRHVLVSLNANIMSLQRSLRIGPRLRPEAPDEDNLPACKNIDRFKFSQALKACDELALYMLQRTAATYLNVATKTKVHWVSA